MREENKKDNSVSGIAAKDFNKGHGFQTSLTAGFEKEVL